MRTTTNQLVDLAKHQWAEEEKMTRIFCYGTLMRGHGNHRLIEHSTFLGTGTTEPIFTMLHLGGFPGIVRGGETAIHGELYEVDAPTLSRLDRLEGHPTFYERQPISVAQPDGTIMMVEGYVLQGARPGLRTIPTGVWAS